MATSSGVPVEILHQSFKGGKGLPMMIPLSAKVLFNSPISLPDWKNTKLACESS